MFFSTTTCNSNHTSTHSHHQPVPSVSTSHRRNECISSNSTNEGTSSSTSENVSVCQCGTAWLLAAGRAPCVRRALPRRAMASPSMGLRPPRAPCLPLTVAGNGSSELVDAEEVGLEGRLFLDELLSSTQLVDTVTLEKVRLTTCLRRFSPVFSLPYCHL